MFAICLSLYFSIVCHERRAQGGIDTKGYMVISSKHLPVSSWQQCNLCFCNEKYPYCRAVKSTKGKVISDKDLEILLDRSDLMGKFYDLQNILFIVLIFV